MFANTVSRHQSLKRARLRDEDEENQDNVVKDEENRYNVVRVEENRVNVVEVEHNRENVDNK